VIEAAPGASLFRRSGSAASNPTIQGVSLRALAPSGAGRALATLDGAPINDPFGGWVNWVALTPETLQGARIVRGAGAGAYGAGALTGVVDFSSRADEGAVADISAGQDGFARGAGYARLGPLLIGGAAETRDGFIPVREGRGPADAPLYLDSWSVTGALQAEMGADRIGGRVILYDEERGSGSLTADAKVEGLFLSAGLSRTETDARLGYRLQLWAHGANLENRFDAVSDDRQTATRVLNQYETPAFGYGANAALRGRSQSFSWEIGADARVYDGETRERYFFLNGVPQRNRRGGGEAAIAGLYAELNRADGPWLVTASARLDAWENTNGFFQTFDNLTGERLSDIVQPDNSGTTPTARLGLSRELGPGVWRVAAYSGFRAPSLNELHRGFRVGDDITNANPLLEPETLWGAETGWRGALGEAFVDLTVFYNRLEDPVTNVTIGTSVAGGALRERRNAGAIDAIGLEGALRYSLSDSLDLRASLAWTGAEIDASGQAAALDGLRPAQTPELSLVLGGDWRPAEALSLRAQYRWESERFEDDLNSRELDAAGVLSARAEWSATPSLAVYLAGDNLLDAAVETRVRAGGLREYAAPRTLRAGLRLTR